MASLSCKISPRTSTVILRDKSPLATAVATSAMFLTWPVRLLAMELTESVKSFQCPRPSRNLRLPSQLSVRSHFARHARYFRGEYSQLLNHGVHDRCRPQKLAFQWPPIHVQSHGLRQITLRHCRDRARHFRRWPQQVFHQCVNRPFHLPPRALRFMEARPLPGSSFLTDHLPHALEFIGHVLIGCHDFVKRVRNLPRQTRPRPG